MGHDHHTREVCRCGAVLSTCRCTAPKTDVVVAESCKTCSPSLLVYPEEESLGLGELIRANASVHLVGVARHNPAGELPAAVVASLLASASKPTTPPDLYPLEAVLASTGMNLNDDFFTPEDTWAARDTPTNKPFNMEHTAAEVVGHMTASVAFVYGGDDGKTVVPITEPCEAFHVAFSAFLYRFWQGDEAAQERMDKTIPEIEAGEWCVSMECRFPRFDYALIPVRHGKADVSQAKIVKRGPDTAHLTRALRAYGGPGTYQGYRVARVLRDLVFSGVGLVRKPANPDSVILSHGQATAGYEPVSDTPKGTSMNEETLKAELEAAKAAKKAADDAAAKVAADLAAAKAELAAATATIDGLKAANAAAQVEAETAKAALAKAAEETKVALRTAKVKEAYGVDDEKAKATASTLLPLSDEAFESHLKAVADLKATALKIGEQKVTNLPSPMAGGAKPVSSAKAAVGSDLLATPEPPTTPEPALAVAAAPPEDLVRAVIEEMKPYMAKTRPQAGK